MAVDKKVHRVPARHISRTDSLAFKQITAHSENQGKEHDDQHIFTGDDAPSDEDEGEGERGGIVGLTLKLWYLLSMNWGNDRISSKVFLRFTQPALEERYMLHLKTLRTNVLRFLAFISIFFMGIFYINDRVSYEEDRARFTFYIRFFIAIPIQCVVTLLTWSPLWHTHFEVITLVGACTFTPFVAIIGAVGNAGAPLVTSVMVFIAFTQILIIRSGIIHAAVVISVHNIAYLAMGELPLDELLVQNLLIFTFIALGMFSAYKSELKARANFLYLWQAEVTHKDHSQQVQVTGDLLRSLVPLSLATRILEHRMSAESHVDSIMAVPSLKMPEPRVARLGPNMKAKATVPSAPAQAEPDAKVATPASPPLPYRFEEADGNPSGMPRIQREMSLRSLNPRDSSHLALLELDFIVTLVMQVSTPQPIRADEDFLGKASQSTPGINLVQGSIQNLQHAIMVGVEHAAISNDISFFRLPLSRCMLVSGILSRAEAPEKLCATMLHLAGLADEIADAVAEHSGYHVECRFGLGAGGPAQAGVFLLNEAWMSDVISPAVEEASFAAACAPPNQVLLNLGAYAHLKDLEDMSLPREYREVNNLGFPVFDSHEVSPRATLASFPLKNTIMVEPGRPVRAANTLAKLPVLSARSAGPGLPSLIRRRASSTDKGESLGVEAGLSSSSPAKVLHRASRGRGTMAESTGQEKEAAVSLFRASSRAPHHDKSASEPPQQLHQSRIDVAVDKSAKPVAAPPRRFQRTDTTTALNAAHVLENMKVPFPQHPWLYETTLLASLPLCHRFPTLRSPGLTDEPMDLYRHGMTLTFEDPVKEASFRRQFVEENPRLLQLVVFVTLLSVIVHGMQDYILAPDTETLNRLLILRYAVEVPLISLYLLYLLCGLFPKGHTPITIVYALLLGSSTTALLLMVETEIRTYYTASVVRIITNLYSGLRLMTYTASLIAWLLFILIECMIWIVYTSQFTFVERTYITAFMLITIFFGMVFVHQMEAAQRHGFLVAKSQERSGRINTGERGVNSRLSSALYPTRFGTLLRSFPAVAESFAEQYVMVINIDIRPLTEMSSPTRALQRLYLRLSESASDYGLHIMRNSGLSFIFIGPNVITGQAVTPDGTVIRDQSLPEARAAADQELVQMIRCAIALSAALPTIHPGFTVKAGIDYGAVDLFASCEFGQHALEMDCLTLSTAIRLASGCHPGHSRIASRVLSRLRENLDLNLDVSFTTASPLSFRDDSNEDVSIETYEGELNSISDVLVASGKIPQLLSKSGGSEGLDPMAELNSLHSPALSRSWTSVDMWTPKALDPQGSRTFDEKVE